MHTYNFHERLEPIEFEKFAKDLLEIRENIVFFGTPKGKDDGVDFYNADKTIIGQVKNYQSFNLLYASLKHEIKKLEKLNLQRYLLIVSNKLKPAQKQKILTLFTKYLKEADLLDGNALNELLDNRKYYEVERTHLKLWVPNTFVLEEVLDSIINKSAYLKTKIELTKIETNAKVFEPSTQFYRALEIVEKESSIIISGEPGIGKTILAHAIVSYLTNVHEKIEFISVNSIEELHNVFNFGRKQVFFFDDFWGDVEKSLHVTNENQKILLDLLNYLKKFDNKWLVLTTREYIFNQVVQSNNKVSSEYKLRKFLLEIDKEDRLLKFGILYNHLKVSGFTREQADTILQNWERIINHSNYNPRIIETFFNHYKNNSKDTSPREIIQGFVDFLDEPYEFFANIFENQTSEAKLVIILLSFLDLNINYIELKESFYKIANNSFLDANTVFHAGFDKALEQLERTFTLSNFEDGVRYLTLKNPSFKDFIMAYLVNHLEEYGELLASNLTGFEEGLKLLKIINQKEQTIYKTKLVNIVTENIISYLEAEKFDYETTKMREIDNLLDYIDINKNKTLKEYVLKYHNTIMSCYVDFWYDNCENYYFFPSYLEAMRNIIPINNPLDIIYDYYYCTGDFNFWIFEDFVKLKNIFPEEFDEFFKAKRKELRTTIVCSIHDYVETFDTEEEDAYYGFDNFICSVEELFKQFGFRYTKQLNEYLMKSYDEFGMTPTKHDYSDWEKDYKLREKKEKEEKKIINEKIKDYLGDYQELTEEEVKNHIEKSDLPPDIKITFSKKLDKADEIFISLIYTKTTLDILLDYFKNYQKFPKNIFELFDFYLKDYSEQELEFTYLFSSFLVHTTKISFTYEDLKEVLTDYNLNLNLDEFINKNLHYSGNWYQFLHPLYYIYLVCKSKLPYNFDLVLSYMQCTWSSWRGKNWTTIYELKTVYYLLSEFDKNKWLRDIVIPAFKDFITETEKDTNEQTALAMLKYFDFEYTVSREDEEYGGFSWGCHNGRLLDFAEMYLDLMISFDLIEGDDRGSLKLVKNDLKDFMEIKSEGYNINFCSHLDNKEFIEILRNSRIIDYLYEAFIEIKKYYDNLVSKTK